MGDLQAASTPHEPGAPAFQGGVKGCLGEFFLARAVFPHPDDGLGVGNRDYSSFFIRTFQQTSRQVKISKGKGKGGLGLRNTPSSWKHRRRAASQVKSAPATAAGTRMPHLRELQSPCPRIPKVNSKGTVTSGHTSASTAWSQHFGRIRLCWENEAAGKTFGQPCS